MNVSNPRRILLLSPSDTNTSPVLKYLLSPKSDQSSSEIKSSNEPTAGELLHEISTSYYSASIPIWQDAIKSTEDWVSEWKAMDGASEVVNAVAAWILVFERPRDQEDLTKIKTLLQGISDIVSHHGEGDPYSDGAGQDALLLAVGLPQHLLPALDLTEEQWEEACQCEGGSWEYIDSEGTGRNAFGELRGLPRLREALESAEWDSGAEIGDGKATEDDLDRLLEDLDENADGQAGHRKEDHLFPDIDGDHELQAELRQILGDDSRNLAQPILNAKPTKDSTASIIKRDANDDGEQEDEDEVEELQRMLLKLQAARDLGADLPQAERKKLAAQAVKEVMRI